MTLINRKSGKYVKKGSMEAIKICDYSGFYFSESDIVQEKEWRGNNLVPTGFWVGKPYLNTPQPQNRPPRVSNDPQPVKLARPLYGADRDQPNAPPADIEKIMLDNLNYSEPVPYNEGLPNGASNPPLPNIGGPDVSKINATQRLALLRSIN